MYSLQGVQPWIKQMVENTQNFMEEGQYHRITGDSFQGLLGEADVSGRIFISPEDIQGEFDFPINVNSPVLDPATYAQIWRQILQDVVSNPILAQLYDIEPIFKNMVTAMGVKNIGEFKLKQQPGQPGPQVQVMPDGQAAKQLQAGNIAPAQDIFGRGPQNIQ